MQLALREWIRFSHRILGSWRYWAVVGGAVLLFAATGPFGTYERVPFGTRLLYWAATMGVTSVVAIAFVAAAAALAPPAWRAALPTMMLGALVSCLPNTLLVAAIIPAFFDTPAPPFGELLWTVVPIGASVAIVTWLVFDRHAPPEANPAANPLIERLPVAKRGPVIRMSMQDHYVEVVTTRGSELVLMRMGDAEAAMGDAGLRVHRSHWIARDHVLGARLEGGGAVVTTSDGAQVPVSRTYVAKLREADLL